MINKFYKIITSFLLIVALSNNTYLKTNADEFTNNNYYWILSSTNTEEENFIDIAYIESWDMIIAVSQSKNIYYKFDYSAVWERMMFTEKVEIEKILLDRNGNIFILDTNKVLFKKDQPNKEWEKVSFDYLGNNLNLDIFIDDNNLILSSIDNIYIYDISTNVWRYFPNTNHLKILSLNVIQDDNIIFAGTKENALWSINLNDGQQIKNDSFSNNIDIETIYMSLNKLNACFLSDSEGNIYRSINYGLTWEKAVNIDSNLKINNFLEDETTLKVFFALTDKGIFLTYSSGESWIPMQNGIENISSSNGLYHPLEESFYVSTLAGIRKSIVIPNVPKPLHPEDGENIFAFKPSLAWQLNTGRGLVGAYRVQVSENINFDEIVFEKENIIGDLVIIPENTLKYHFTYYWRVLVETPYWISHWSEVYSFTLRHKWVLTEGEKTYKWNEKKFSYDLDEHIYPFISKNLLFVPLRSFIESQKGIVSWDNNEKEVLILFKNKKVNFSLGKNYYIEDGNIKSLIDDNQDVIPIIINNRIFVPLRVLCNIYNWTLEWDPDIKSAIVSELSD